MNMKIKTYIELTADAYWLRAIDFFPKTLHLRYLTGS